MTDIYYVDRKSKEVEKEKGKNDGVNGDGSQLIPDGTKDQKLNETEPTDHKAPISPPPSQ